MKRLFLLLAFAVILAGVPTADAACPESPDLLCSHECGYFMGFQTCIWTPDTLHMCITVLPSPGCVQGTRHCACTQFPI